MTRILLAVDGTDLDQKLAAAAKELFPAGELFAVNVQHAHQEAIVAANTPGTIAVTYVKVPDSVGTAADAAREVAESHSPADAIPLGEVGHRVEQIVAAATEHRVDAIVVGHRHRNWWARLFDPSVSARVTERSPVPVLVVTAE